MRENLLISVDLCGIAVYNGILIHVGQLSTLPHEVGKGHGLWL